uniref:Uncharacterized protein n=1 Tax=Anopheles maculatus TaxID=74869 RepID=A0A182T9W9_9DIPT
MSTAANDVADYEVGVPNARGNFRLFLHARFSTCPSVTRPGTLPTIYLCRSRIGPTEGTSSSFGYCFEIISIARILPMRCEESVWPRTRVKKTEGHCHWYRRLLDGQEERHARCPGFAGGFYVL